MRFKELLQKDVSELEGMREEKRVRLDSLKRQVAVRAVTNVREMRVLRKDIARIETRIAALRAARA